MIAIIIVALIGLCVSIYTYHVERSIKQSPTYKPACDLSDRVSCTKPMLSPYANLFFFSNASIGIAYYAVITLLAAINAIMPLFILSIASCLVSVVLAYILYFKIKAFCILCTSVYIINFLILILAAYQLYA